MRHTVEHIGKSLRIIDTMGSIILTSLYIFYTAVILTSYYKFPLKKVVNSNLDENPKLSI